MKKDIIFEANNCEKVHSINWVQAIEIIFRSKKIIVICTGAKAPLKKGHNIPLQYIYI